MGNLSRRAYFAGRAMSDALTCTVVHTPTDLQNGVEVATGSPTRIPTTIRLRERGQSQTEEPAEDNTRLIARGQYIGDLPATIVVNETDTIELASGQTFNVVWAPPLRPTDIYRIVGLDTIR